MTTDGALVTGAGGFIGHHLVKALKRRGYWVRGVDIKTPEYEPSTADQFFKLDLREPGSCVIACDGMHEVYNLAADMGGIGYITANHADIARNNILINANMLEAALRAWNVRRFLYSSSACVYPQYLQDSPDVTPLREDDAYPADPEEGYGWEKLFTEKLCQYYREDHGLQTRIVRFHNVYGNCGTFDGGKEKAPAALCRKIALANPVDEIEVWGDGEQTRSFMHIDDCVEGIYRIAQSGYTGPLNLGTDRLVTINDLAGIIAKIAGKNITLRHDLTKPQGVRGRNSDNSLTNRMLGWTPSIPLEVGLVDTYQWIADQVKALKTCP